MDIRKVKKLIELAQETGIAELEIHEDKDSVRIAHHAPGQMQTINVPAASLQPNIPATEQHIAKPTPPSEPAQPDGHPIKAPMIGTVYISSTPGASPFVEVGQHVQAGDTLCTIEAMKMFNQIEADRAGIVSARLIENGQPVEYDQMLFLIDPSQSNGSDND